MQHKNSHRLSQYGTIGKVLPHLRSHNESVNAEKCELRSVSGANQSDTMLSLTSRIGAAGAAEGRGTLSMAAGLQSSLCVAALSTEFSAEKYC